MITHELTDEQRYLVARDEQRKVAVPAFGAPVRQ